MIMAICCISVTIPMDICNQGCGTRVYFKYLNGVLTPFNVTDNEPHKKTCMSLKIGKWWGGEANTIVIDWIKASIETSYKSAMNAIKTRSIEDHDKAIKLICSELEFVMRTIKDQEKRNALEKKGFAEYKTNLVAQQTLREERKKAKAAVKFQPTMLQQFPPALEEDDSPESDGLQSKM